MPAKEPSVLLQPLPVEAYALTAEDQKRFGEERRLGIVAPSDPILRHAARAVGLADIDTEAVRATVSRLMRIAAGQQRSNLENRKKRTLVGLAAPQIGEDLRIIVIDTKIKADRKRPGKLECFINPQISWRSRETEEGREGCFSAGPVWGLVRRSVAVKLRALTPEGKVVERVFEGFTARIVQHECDHLDGIRFPERITSDKRRHWVHSEEIPLYAKHIKHWPRLCSLARWHELCQAPTATIKK